MPPTALITHTACLYHETPPGHPESADRLRAVLQALSFHEFNELTKIDAPLVSVEQVTRVHPQSIVEAALGAVPDYGFAQIDGDTILSPGSGQAALRAAGALVHGVDLVMGGQARNVFCAVRPPGHHAEPEAAMGFCLFNNVAIGALHAREAHGIGRVAVLDFDVHHGNGTQEAFARDPNLFFASTHQMPLYPGTGRADERGAGNIHNVPLPYGAGSQAFRDAWSRVIFPALDAFGPGFVLISAGFDAHQRDPLANLNVLTSDFAWVTTEICKVSARHCEGRVVSTLEGGYDLSALAESAAAHVGALMKA